MNYGKSLSVYVILAGLNWNYEGLIGNWKIKNSTFIALQITIP